MSARRETRARTGLWVALALAALVGGAAFALVGCAAQRPPSSPPGIVGAVTSLVPGDGRPASVLVESTGTASPGSISDKAQVNIPPATRFFDASGNAASLEAIAGIRQGSQVRVWFQGAVAESYPVQGSADTIQILGR